MRGLSLQARSALGATWAFHEWDENLVKPCWRGRWRDANTLWHYVQELQALQVLQSIPEAPMALVRALASLLSELGEEVLESELD